MMFVCHHVRVNKCLLALTRARDAGIGFGTVLNISIRKAKSRLRGNTQALCVTSKFNQSRFEFVFTSLVKNSPRLFTTVQAVLRCIIISIIIIN